MRGERPLFSGPWFARTWAHCDWNSSAWNSRTFPRPLGHPASSLGYHHHWTHFLRVWPLGDSSACWGGVSLRDWLNPESGGAKNRGAATTTKEKSLKKPSSTRQDVDHFQTCAEAATSLYRPYACLNIGITKSMAIPPLPDRNHRRGVLFTAGNSSRNTVISKPPPRNAVAKARVKSKIGCNKKVFKSPQTNAALPIQRLRWRNRLEWWITEKRSASKTWLATATVNKTPHRIPALIKEGSE